MSVATVRTFLETISEIRTTQVITFLGNIFATLFDIFLITLFKLLIISIFKIATIEILKFFALGTKLNAIFSKSQKLPLINLKDVNINLLGEEVSHSEHASGTSGYSAGYPAGYPQDVFLDSSDYYDEEYQDIYTGKYAEDKAFKEGDNKKQMNKKVMNEGQAYDQDKKQFFTGVRKRWS